MSEEAQDAGQGSVTEATQTNDNAQPASGRDKPAGYDPVDLSGLPEDLRAPLEDRFKYLYTQVKTNEREKVRLDRTLNEFRGVAASQSQKIEELMGGFGEVVNHLENKTINETETSLKQQMRAAYESGDNDKYFEIQDKLDDIRLEKKFAAKTKKDAPKQERQQPQTQVEDSGIAPEDQRVISSWQDERDDSGVMLRPWAINRGTMDNPDKQYLAALAETRAVLMSPLYSDKTMEEKMAEVDRRMGVAKQGARQNVIGGGLTGGRKTTKITLSPKQQEIATRTKFAGPGKSDADHLEAYRKQIEQSKGARA